MPLGADATIAIIGGSLAGLRAAETLRAEGFTGTITVVGAESHLPYDRPPLSKQFLAGTWGLDRVQLRTPDKIDALGLDLRLGRRALSLDIEGGAVIIDDGEPLVFDGLVVATGAEPRPLPGAPALTGMHTLRTLEDSISLGQATAEEGIRVVVVGAGFIGSEVAATCRGRGAHVTVLEALAQPLSRVLGDEMGAVCGALHANHGVELRTGVGVVGVHARDGGPGAGEFVAAVELDDGTLIDADVVVVGIGVVPTTDWLAGSGLELANGVVAGPTLHAASNVVVAGDAARWFDERLGEHIRIEHWTNAAEQGAVAARNLLAGESDATAYSPVPYFWSDQYDIKIQVIGHPDAEADVVVVDGSVDEGRFVALYGHAGRLTAALGFSRPRQLMGYRPLLEAGASFDEALALTG